VVQKHHTCVWENGRIMRSANRVQIFARVHTIVTEMFVVLITRNSKISKELLKIYYSLE